MKGKDEEKMKKYFKKGFALLLAATLCLTVFTACGKDEAPETPETVKGEVFETEMLSALAPDGWKAFQGADSFDEYEGDYDPTTLNIIKGGDTIIVPISAKTGMGLDELLEMVILTAEVQELKANPNRRAKGTVIEARLDKTRGPVATLLVQNGTLKQGDIVIAGTAVGRVRVMTNDKGRTVKTAGPSVPVEITGLADVPTPGDEFNAVTDERMARELVEQRRQAQKDAAAKLNQKVTLDNLFAKMQEGEMKELNLIVKADVQGSAGVAAAMSARSGKAVQEVEVNALVARLREIGAKVLLFFVITKLFRTFF